MQVGPKLPPAALLLVHVLQATRERLAHAGGLQGLGCTRHLGSALLESDGGWHTAHCYQSAGSFDVQQEWLTCTHAAHWADACRPFS